MRLTSNKWLPDFNEAATCSVVIGFPAAARHPTLSWPILIRPKSPEPCSEAFPGDVRQGFDLFCRLGPEQHGQPVRDHHPHHGRLAVSLSPSWRRPHAPVPLSRARPPTLAGLQHELRSKSCLWMWYLSDFGLKDSYILYYYTIILLYIIYYIIIYIPVL